VAHACLGEYAAAKRALEAAIEARERLLPPNHLSLGDSLANYAHVLEKLGHGKEARPYRKRAKAIHERSKTENLTGITVDAAAWR
jgi:hypothetical protein